MEFPNSMIAGMTLLFPQTTYLKALEETLDALDEGRKLTLPHPSTEPLRDQQIENHWRELMNLARADKTQIPATRDLLLPTDKYIYHHPRLMSLREQYLKELRALEK